MLGYDVAFVALLLFGQKPPTVSMWMPHAVCCKSVARSPNQAIEGSAPAPIVVELRRKAQERMRRDQAEFTATEFQEIEALFQAASKSLGTSESRDRLAALIKKYPKSNRAGCALVYLAQGSVGEDKTGYLNDAISQHSDSWYGDGVQVGAIARAQLAAYSLRDGQVERAQKLVDEVMALFPDAIDHAGNPLADSFRRMKLLK